MQVVSKVTKCSSLPIFLFLLSEAIFLCLENAKKNYATFTLEWCIFSLSKLDVHLVGVVSWSSAASLTLQNAQIGQIYGLSTEYRIFTSMQKPTATFFLVAVYISLLRRYFWFRNNWISVAATFTRLHNAGQIPNQALKLLMYARYDCNFIRKRM